MDSTQRGTERGAPDGPEKSAPGQHSQGIQDSFLNAARKERLNVTIYLVSGVKLTGKIRSFDKYALVLESGSQEQLIYKHAISTVVTAKTHLPQASSGHSASPAAREPQAETQEA